MTDVYKAPDAQLHDPKVPGEYGSIEKALAGDYEFQPVEVIKQAWANLKGFKTTLWLAILAYSAISMVFSLVLNFTVGQTIDPQTSEFSFPGLLGQIVMTAVMMPLAAGLYMISIKYSVGAKIEVGELFKHFDKTLPLFIMTVLFYVTVVLGFVLLLIPGIYLLVAYSFAMPLVVEKNMGPWEALNTSRKAVTHKWFNMFGFILLVMLVALAGVLALLVGLLWAIPLVSLAGAIAYRDIFGVEDKTLNGE